MSDPYDERARWIARAIGHLRLQKGITLQDLAALASERGHRVHPDSMSRLVTGSRKLTVADLLVLVDVLEVDIVPLLDGRIEIVLEDGSGEDARP